MARTHLIGLLLGTEEDWSEAFETLVARTGAAGVSDQFPASPAIT